MNLLLMSSSRSATTDFLEANNDEIADILRGVKRALLIPYAVVGEVRESGMDFVRERVKQFGVDLENIDAADDAVEAVNRADAILVSGGNTFCLLKALYDRNLVEPIRTRVREGAPYIGWSAGSNVACRSIRTTNDMPIAYPPTFRALDLVPIQINPHYSDATPEGLRGETRMQRIEEFLAVNPAERVIGLPEGDALRVRGATMHLVGEYDAWLFTADSPRQRLEAGRDLSHLL